METERDLYLRQALQFARVGEKEQARQYLIEILRQDRTDFDAWVAMAQVAEDRQRAINAIKEALRLSPDDAGARRYLDYLTEGEKDNRAPARVSPWFWGSLGAILIALLLVAAIFVLPRLGSQAQASQSGAQQIAGLPADCSSLIDEALEVSDQGCQQIGRNQVCYGHNTVQAKLVPGADARFDEPGNTIPVNLLETFVTSPLDLQNGEWGVGVFRVEANLPGTLPGQLVTMLAFGDASIWNASGDMQAFYFTSGLTGIECSAVDLDGLLVRMPDGAGFTFKVNGTDVALKGSSMLQAVKNDNLSVTTLSGTGTVSAFGQEQTLGPGQKVIVPLGGDSGLDAEGPPDPPQIADTTTADAGCVLTGSGCPEPPALSAPGDTESTTVVDITDDAGAPADPVELVEPTDDRQPPTGLSTPTAPSRLTLVPATLEPNPTKEPKLTKEPKETGEPKATEVVKPTEASGDIKPTKEPKKTKEPDPTKEPTTPAETALPPVETAPPAETVEPKETKDPKDEKEPTPSDERESAPTNP